MRVTDRRTDKQTVAYTHYSIYGVACNKIQADNIPSPCVPSSVTCSPSEIELAAFSLLFSHSPPVVLPAVENPSHQTTLHHYM